MCRNCTCPPQLLPPFIAAAPGSPNAGRCAGMKRPHELARENEALRDRLGEAGLRVTEDPGSTRCCKACSASAPAPAAARYVGVGVGVGVAAGTGVARIGPATALPWMLDATTSTSYSTRSPTPRRLRWCRCVLHTPTRSRLLSATPRSSCLSPASPGLPARPTTPLSPRRTTSTAGCAAQRAAGPALLRLPARRLNRVADYRPGRAAVFCVACRRGKLGPVGE